MVNRFYQTLKETWNVVKAHKKESALIALTIGLGLQRCGRTEYEYCGMVEQDSVKFETKFLMRNYLIFYNQNGKITLMDDEGYNKLEFKKVKILNEEGSEENYANLDGEVGKYVVEAWQAKADSVLPEILKIKAKKAEQEREQEEQERQEKIKYGLSYLK